MGKKFKQLFKDGEWSNLVGDGRCPVYILERILVFSELKNDKYWVKKVKETLQRKEKYRKERQELQELRTAYKVLKEKEDEAIEEVSYLLHKFWNLEIVCKKYRYSVVLPKYGSDENYYRTATSYEEMDFFEKVMEGVVKV